MVEDGELTGETILDVITPCLGDVRQANATLRWLMLHSSPLSPVAEQMKRCRQLRELVLAETAVPQLELFQLLLNVSQFELKLRTLYKTVLDERERRWENYKKVLYVRRICHHESIPRPPIDPS